MGVILVAALIAALSLLVEHWFPWRLMLRRDLPRLAAYVLGVLALLLPLTGVYVYWLLRPGDKPAWAGAELAALWVIIVTGGVVVLVAYGLDWVIRHVTLAKELGELLDLREGRYEERCMAAGTGGQEEAY